MPEGGNSSVRILCVDDNEIIVHLLTAIIKKTGFWGCIDVASSGPEALQLVKKHEYSLIFMDYNMPGMNGAEVTALLRGLQQMMPIVGITAATNMHDICLKAGMNQVLCKPFTQEGIAEVLRKYL